MKISTNFLISVAALVLISVPVLAHHGNASYDNADHPITIKGTVTEFAWSNPHVQIYLDVKDDKGKSRALERGKSRPGKLVRAGWSKDKGEGCRSSPIHSHSGEEGRARGLSPQARACLTVRSWGFGNWRGPKATEKLHLRRDLRVANRRVSPKRNRRPERELRENFPMLNTHG